MLRKQISKLASSLTLIPSVIHKQLFSSRKQIENALPIGEIPEELKLNRPYQFSTLSNGMRLSTETLPLEIATISAFINCGSRQETRTTSGSAHFLEHLHFKVAKYNQQQLNQGTSKWSRNQLELSVENIGGQLNAYTSRENTSYTITVFKKNLENAFDILSQMLLFSKYDKESIEIERETIFAELLETQKMQMESLVEYTHQNAYQNHQMGKPILGMIENIQTISQGMIKDYYNRNYHAKNMAIVGVGCIEQDQLEKFASKYFSSVPQTTNQKLFNQQKPKFETKLKIFDNKFVEDMQEGLNVGTFFEAPCWSDKDYYAFLIFQRIICDNTENILEKQMLQGDNFRFFWFNQFQEQEHNTFQKELLKYPEIFQQKCIYTPYSDTGIFGNFYFGKTDSLPNMLKLSDEMYENCFKNLREEELNRAKNKIYLELLQHETGNDLTQAIGNQLIYLKRRILRTEIAQRISNYTCEDIAKSAERWLKKKKYSTTIWANRSSLRKINQKFLRDKFINL